MKSSAPKRPVSFFGIICTTVGHNYKVTRKVTNHINEYKCSHCGREVTDNISGNVELLTNKMREVNSNVSSYFKRRSNRISAQRV
jgi:hypothetical protein